MKKGDLLDLEISGYAFEGKGIAKINKSESDKKNFVIFVKGSYPGDKVIAKLIKVKKSYAEAIAEKVIFPSKDRVNAKCKFFGVCGGCSQQNLNYEIQIKYKQQHVRETFEKLAGFKNLNIEDIIPSENIFYYRNKMEFSFSDKRWLTKNEIFSNKILNKNFALGLHVPGIYDKVLDIDECFLQSEISNSILNFTRNFFKQKEISIYNTKTHQGFLRNLVIRQSFHSNEIMVNLVTSSEDENLLKEYSNFILEKIPRITTIINNVNLKKASVAIGDYEKVYFGNGFIYDSIGRYKFRVSANSFFQTNTLQAEKLYKTALEFADLNENDVVYDLYSGAGTIAIYISEKAKNIFGFESVESAVNDAKENVKINKIENVNFITTDLYKSFLPIAEEKNIPKPDVVILDPPRSGMHKNTVEDVIKLSPKKIIYVSCNPATQVRDIKLFSESGYKLIKAKPVDMFPHTFHIENVALLKKD